MKPLDLLLWFYIRQRGEHCGKIRWRDLRAISSNFQKFVYLPVSALCGNQVDVFLPVQGGCLLGACLEFQDSFLKTWEGKFRGPSYVAVSQFLSSKQARCSKHCAFWWSTLNSVNHKQSLLKKKSNTVLIDQRKKAKN